MRIVGDGGGRGEVGEGSENEGKGCQGAYDVPEGRMCSSESCEELDREQERTGEKSPASLTPVTLLRWECSRTNTEQQGNKKRALGNQRKVKEEKSLCERFYKTVKAQRRREGRKCKATRDDNSRRQRRGERRLCDAETTRRKP
jgi:hypothetical protein